VKVLALQGLWDRIRGQIREDVTYALASTLALKSLSSSSIFIAKESASCRSTAEGGAREFPRQRRASAGRTNWAERSPVGTPPRNWKSSCFVSRCRQSWFRRANTITPFRQEVLLPALEPRTVGSATARSPHMRALRKAVLVRARERNFQGVRPLQPALAGGSNQVYRVDFG
jgi:hypothetical protein